MQVLPRLPFKRKFIKMFLANLLTSCLFHCTPVAADMVSTEIVLRDPFMQEQNIKNRNARLAVNTGIMVGSVWLDKKLEKKKGLQWAFRIGHLLIGAYAVQHNFRELEKAQAARTRIKQFGR